MPKQISRRKSFDPKPCEWCGVMFTPVREWHRFHSPECRVANHLATHVPVKPTPPTTPPPDDPPTQPADPADETTNERRIVLPNEPPAA